MEHFRISPATTTTLLSSSSSASPPSSRTHTHKLLCFFRFGRRLLLHLDTHTHTTPQEEKETTVPDQPPPPPPSQLLFPPVHPTPPNPTTSIFLVAVTQSNQRRDPSPPFVGQQHNTPIDLATPCSLNPEIVFVNKTLSCQKDSSYLRIIRSCQIPNKQNPAHDMI